MPLDLDLFHDPDFGGEGIAYSWIDKARRTARRHEDFPEFDRFSYLWMAFAAWGMCVTLAETDAAMLRALKADQNVNEVFNNIVRDPQVRESLRTVEGSFPLASFSDLLRLDPRYNWRGERDAAYWQKIAEAPRGKKVRLSPKLDHRNLNWPDTLECTYKVRCNLVHGGKRATRLPDL
ncbi:hypothetical protein J2W51_006080 [Tardiphaga robiniae]|uniref:hypothetical protein n=1 Tax=Tardiphaga robiniae TaxID=943830 RepID=UPI0028564548|nr:hypothetical protein [Tardiphaga robiniae]MDR6663486.1 hypothetical protein [Tardiphaga robiniae]